MKRVIDILRGMVIGLANVIPGVSGGTMMVSMGIYDTLIHCITHLFSEFKKSVKTLLPYAVGMVIAIILGSVALKTAFDSYPLPTNTLFIGLILGSIPIILKQLKGQKINALTVILFLVFAALVIVPKAIANATLTADNPNGAGGVLGLDFGGLLISFLLGVIASASMVVPGISGSMMLKILGYYEFIVTDTLGATFKEAIPQGNWALVGHNVLILLPFAVGIVVGIFGVAKLIELLIRKWKGYTYAAILGMVAASPVVILMDRGIYEKGTGWVILLVSLVAFVAGFFIATRLGGDPEQGGNPEPSPEKE